METIFLVITIGAVNVACFFLGAKIGQKIVRQETIEMPNLNPVKAVNNAITEYKQTKEKEAEDEYYKTILHNIDVYDGTSTGQKKVPFMRK